MAKDIKLERIKRFSKTAELVIRIFYIASIVFIFITIAMLIATLTLPKDFLSVKHFGNGGFSLDAAGTLRYDLMKAGVSGDVSLSPIFQSISIAAFFYSLTLAYILCELKHILKTVSQNVPFDIRNSQRILNIGATLIMGSVVFNLLNYLVAKSIITTFSVPNINTNFSVNLSLLLSGLLLIILSGVFRYGSYLQNEYDTTL